MDPIRGAPVRRAGVSDPLPDRLSNGGGSGDGPRRTGLSLGVACRGRGGPSGRVALRGGAGAEGAEAAPGTAPGALPAGGEPAGRVPVGGGADGRALRAPSAGRGAGDGALAGAEGSTLPTSASATVRCGAPCPASGFTVAAPAGRRLTTTVRRGFLTTTIRRRSSPGRAAGRAAGRAGPEPAGEAGAAAAGRSSPRGGVGATLFGSGLRLIRVARGRGFFSSLSGRSLEGSGDGVFFSSLILSKYNAVPGESYIRIVATAAAGASHEYPASDPLLSIAPRDSVRQP